MVELKQHQREAVNKLENGNILCGGVGTGKSLTALAYYITKVCSGRINSPDQVPYVSILEPVDLYIITTARKRDTMDWEKEMCNFLLYPPNPDWHINVTVDSWNNIGKYVNIKGAFFIFDEQRVVGKGAWVKSFLKITKVNQWILLSATPGDDWQDYIPVFIANGFYRNRTEFMERHAVYNNYTKYPKVDRYVDTRRLEKMRAHILVIMHYEKSTHPHVNYISVTYNKKEFKLVWKERWNSYENEPIKNVSELCYLMRRVVNSDISRLEALSKILTDGHNRLIIFYNFDYELEILRQFAEDNHINYAEWNGHVHEEVPTSPEWLYLVQYTAGAEGWNCITTNTIVFYSLNYSYKITAQAAGRVDRLNTPYTDLYYYYLVSNSPIDLGIRRALQQKKKFNESSFVKSKSR
jgi:hypothetical protein